MTEKPRITYVGHATVLIEIDGVRILTDPLLRGRVGLLRSKTSTFDEGWRRDLDAILISHPHRDHLDAPSLRSLEQHTKIVVPTGVGRRARQLGFSDINEVDVGDAIEIGGVSVTATPAAHGRLPRTFKPPTPVGYLVESTASIYFAGDTDLFSEMEEISDELDVALLPIWGWGPRLGAGHLDPRRAAEALRLLKPKVAIPIHWGVLHPVGIGWTRPGYLSFPAHRFLRDAGRRAPEVDVRVLEPGQAFEFERLSVGSSNAPGS